MNRNVIGPNTVLIYEWKRGFSLHIACVKPAETTGRKANEFPILCIIKISSGPSQRYPVFACLVHRMYKVLLLNERTMVSYKRLLRKNFFIYSFIDTFDIKYEGE